MRAIAHGELRSAEKPVQRFQKNSQRKEPKPLDILVRSGVVVAYAHIHQIEIEQARATLARRFRRYDEDETRALCEYMMRGTDVHPATTFVEGWAAELAEQVNADVTEAVMERSAFAQLAQNGMSLQFGRAGHIAIPGFAPTLAGAFIREGEPIPLAQGESFAAILTKKKMAVIVGFTRELDEGSVPTFEGMMRARIQENTAVVLDRHLLDDEPGTDIRPPGLLFGAAGLGGSGVLQGDLSQVVEAISRGYVRNLVLIMHPVQALAVRMGQAYKPLVIVSSVVPLGTIIALDAADFACVRGVPRFEISKEAALHFSDTPEHIADGAPASPVRSLWQTDSLALRMILPVDWCVRRAAAVVKLTQAFTSPASGATDVAHVTTTEGVNVGDRVWVPPTGYFEVTDKQDD